MSSTMERPIALIVEDQPDTLATRRELFTTYGFQAIGAKDFDQALREFRATPTIDVVVTDINLDGNDENDRSGVNLARAIRLKRPHLPIIAYSGHVDVLDASEKAQFNDALLKAELTVTKFASKLYVWRDQALEYRAKRAETAKNELSRMRSEGTLMEPDVDILRDFLPGLSSGVTAVDSGDFSTPDDMLRREGWRFRLVEAGFVSLGEPIKTRVAVPFWTKLESEGAVAVLQGHSCIYNFDVNEDTAISGALELMLGYFEEFKKDSSRLLSPELDELTQYLKKVFE